MLTNAAGAAVAGKAVAEWDQGEKPKQPPMMAGTFTGTSSIAMLSVSETIRVQNVVSGADFNFAQAAERRAPLEYQPKLRGLELAPYIDKLFPKS